MKIFIKAILFLTLFSTQTIADTYQDILLSYNNGNFTKTFEMASEIAKKDDPTGQFILGELYQKGLGVERNYPQALLWYKKAADQGLIHAQFNLGNLYE
ncbi:tetratricopeptide repeat protein [Kiloniella majae]|uniref:tetratricopeptide repeat protein n=1 Tax=Kiloniella majae TaxID=1938558 RepID=UPI000A27719F|nr:tetratricopeptide repeat protein [Kiloniella majae]